MIVIDAQWIMNEKWGILEAWTWTDPEFAPIHLVKNMISFEMTHIGFGVGSIHLSQLNMNF